tara:strand:- start:606 stop:788 length:183 start_codon:yes stop_codon:yes gene_type:complete
MKVLNDNDEKVVMEFTKHEYHQIRNWMIGKKAGNIDIDTRDTLENFLGMKMFMNPNDKFN